jgi:signal transduction histidine kinase
MSSPRVDIKEGGLIMKELTIYKYLRPIVYSLILAVTGYFIAHPIAVFVYTFLHQYERDIFQAQREISRDFAQSTYQPTMLILELSFVIAGCLAGLLLSLAADRRRRRRDEEERRKAALETLHQLTVTLSHYVLNANAVIGGMARHMKRVESSGEVGRSLSVVEDQTKKIDATIAALRKITEIRTSTYIPHEQTRMIDIAEDVEDELRKAQAQRGRPSLYKAA